MADDDSLFDLREPPPKYVYKYRSLRDQSFEFTRAIVQDNTVWFSKPADFNDPFDCAPALSAECTDAEFDNYLRDMVQKQGQHMSRVERRAAIKKMKQNNTHYHRSQTLKKAFDEIVPRIVNRAGILSLSAKCDDVLMWSHYADSHQGCCLRFNTEGSPFSHARRVVYSKNRPFINMIRDEQGEMLFKSLLTKADFWSYEQEWRIIKHSDGSGPHRYDPARLDGVIFGARVKDETRSKAMKWIEGRTPPVQVLTAEFDPEHFRLTVA
ncbi:DUF2971 domain-containing protein [Methylorubrum extorquens]